MTIQNPQLIARIVLLCVVAVFLQIAAVAQLPLFGAYADLTPLVVMAVALLCGVVPGACVGFVLGLMIDISQFHLMGLTSLVLLVVGWWVGRVRELRDPQSPFAPIAIGAGAAAIATIGYGIGQFLLGFDSPLSWLLVKQTLATIVLDALLAMPVLALVRRWLLPSLPDDPRRRRRRAYTTGGLLAPAEGMSGYHAPEDRRPPITPGLAVRVAALGFVALGLFAIIFFRLWFLQVLAGDKYLAQANENRVRDVAIPAPRGDIVDRTGAPIVDSRLANVVQLDPRSLPQATRDAAAEWGRDAGILARRYRREHPDSDPIEDPAPLPPIPAMPPDLEKRFVSLGKVLDLRPETIMERAIHSLAVLPYGAITLRVDVPRTMILYLQERKKAYPGVVPDTLYLRHYPNTTLAAQVLGNVGQINEDELKLSRYKDVLAGSVIGKSGIEYQYDQYLRGRDGAQRLQIDSQGNFVGELRSARRDPVIGSRVKLSLDLGLQRAGEEALQKGMELARQNANSPTGGAFVAMNPKSGAIAAMGSAPTFDPSIFTKPISDKNYRDLNSDESGKPLFDRAANGAYPTGSIFKPITAFAALQAARPTERITPDFRIVDDGCIEVDNRPKCNAKNEKYGSIILHDALRVSSDVYFYEIGKKTNSVRTETIQSMARKLGLGRHTGIDLPSGTKGLMPDWRWRQQVAKREVKCRKDKKLPLSMDVYTAGARGCGITDMRQWSQGDNINLAVGQGDIQASPLQMAVAYSAIAMDGRVPTPHLGTQIEDKDGNQLQKLPDPPARTVKLDAAGRAAILQGLHEATTEPDGTSTTVWEGWDQDRYPVYGKTGTAETGVFPNVKDQSWYACWIKDNAKPDDPGIVIVVTIEKGGFGAEAAAPAARLIASKYFGVKAEVHEGDSQTR